MKQIRIALAAVTLGALTAPAQGRARAPRERPLAKLPALPQPHGATLTWLDVLRVLDVLERGASWLFLAEIAATHPEEAPHHRICSRCRRGAPLRCQHRDVRCFRAA